MLGHVWPIAWMFEGFGAREHQTSEQVQESAGAVH